MSNFRFNSEFLLHDMNFSFPFGYIDWVFSLLGYELLLEDIVFRFLLR